jgi:hypothetical protein
LHAAEGTAIELFLGENGQARLEDCLLTGAIGLHLGEAYACRLSLLHCTVIAPRAVEIAIDEPTSLGSNMSVAATHSLFKSREGLISVANPMQSVDEFTRVLKWQGSNNVYSGPFVILGEDDLEDSPSWCRSFEEWKTTFARSVAARVRNWPL